MALEIHFYHHAAPSGDIHPDVYAALRAGDHARDKRRH
jgi:hypothetical protein